MKGKPGMMMWAREKGDVVDESAAAVAEDEEEEDEEVEGRRR